MQLDLTAALPSPHNAPVRRLPAIALLLAFLATGTGALAWAHELNHQVQETADHEPDHCDVCVQLHLPVMPAGWTPLLVCLGLFAAFLTLLTRRLASQRIALSVCCRGPPAV